MPGDAYRYLGNFSAVDPVYSVSMQCHDCAVQWLGCWDNFECPLCGKGELPWRPEDGFGLHSAQAIEARHGGDAASGSVHESAVANGDAPKEILP